MPRYINRAAVCALLVVVSGARLARADQTQSNTADLCDKSEATITKCLADGKIRDAVISACDYETAVHACYPATSFANGVVQSEADHMSFAAPFAGWKQFTAKDTGIPYWVSSVGVDSMLLLQSPQNGDTVLVMSMDVRVTSPTMVDANGGISERDMTILSDVMVRQMGTKISNAFVDVGDRRLLCVDLTGKSGESVQVGEFSNNGKIYSFLTISPVRDKAEMKTKLISMAKSVSFAYKPADSAKIASIRLKITDASDVKQQLRCVRELAMCGEYGDACLEIGNLRRTIAALIPKPVIQDNGIRYDSYKMVVVNPDPAKWKCEVHLVNGVTMMALEDKSSGSVHGIIIGVMDPVLTYGAHANKIVGATAGEAANRAFLSSAARAGLLRLGQSLDSERYRTWQGAIAYEAVAGANIPNVKAKVILTLHSNYVLFLMLLVDDKSPVHQFAANEAMLDKVLKMN